MTTAGKARLTYFVGTPLCPSAGIKAPISPILISYLTVKMALDHTNSLQDEMSIDSMFVASDIWPQLTGSDHCPSWADAKLAMPLPQVTVPPIFSTRNTFTGRQNKLTGWLKPAPAKSNMPTCTETESNTESVKQKQSLHSASARIGAQGGDLKKVGMLLRSPSSVSLHTSISSLSVAT